MLRGAAPVGGHSSLVLGHWGDFNVVSLWMMLLEFASYPSAGSSDACAELGGRVYRKSHPREQGWRGQCVMKAGRAQRG